MVRTDEVRDEFAAGRFLTLLLATWGGRSPTVGVLSFLGEGADALMVKPAMPYLDVIAAAREAGIRITLLDTCYLNGGIGREAEGVQLRFSDDAIEAIAEEALARNVGARGLKIIIEDLMLDVMYQIPSDEDIEECVITRDVVKHHTNPITILRKAG